MKSQPHRHFPLGETIHFKQMIDTDKLLLPLSETKINAVLLLNGCFNPIHKNHIRLLEVAREHLDSLGTYHLVGGYISPTHDAGIERKLAVVHLPWHDRLAMCRLAVRDSSWIMVDAWQIAQEKNQGAKQSKQHLSDVLRNSYPSIQIISICGGDALPKFKGVFQRELVIAILNRPVDDFDFDPWFHSAPIARHHHNIMLLYDHLSAKHMSSTSIRREISQSPVDAHIDDLHVDVLDYHRSHNITYRSVDQTILWSDLEEKSMDVELGHGRCATVYAGRFQDRPVAIKVIRERRQFEHEAKVLTLLAKQSSFHSNVIGILGIGDQFCVMEKCETDLLSYILAKRVTVGQTLHELFPNEQWSQWIRHMLTGFVHLVSLGVLHRDIKTDNMLLVNHTVKIADFSVSVNTNNMTRMPCRGSIRHYAPEAIDDKALYTEKADVYMFGCLLYEIVHGGERIWSEMTTHDVVTRRLNGEQPAFTVPCDPWLVETIVRDCWPMNGHDRLTFEEILQKTPV